VSVTGSTATLTISEGPNPADTAVGSFTVALATNANGIRDAAGNQSSFAATAPADKAAPARITLEMFDANANGKVDQVKGNLLGALAAYTAATAPWTLANVPSGGTLSSVSVTGSTATLTISEGPNPADTAVGSFTVALATNANGIRDAAGNQSSFAATAPADKAAPARITLEMFDANANGKVDQVKGTFSEPLAAYTAAAAPWTLANVPSGGTLSSVSVTGSTATLTISEGAAAANTAVGSFTVAMTSNAAGIRDGASNLAPTVGVTAPTDKAAPILSTVTRTGGNHNDTLSGTTTENNGTMTINVYGGANASGPILFTYTVVSFGPSSPFTWSMTSKNNELTGNAQYTAQVIHVDTAGNQSNGPTVTFNATP